MLDLWYILAIAAIISLVIIIIAMASSWPATANTTTIVKANNGYANEFIIPSQSSIMDSLNVLRQQIAINKTTVMIPFDQQLTQNWINFIKTNPKVVTQIDSMYYRQDPSLYLASIIMASNDATTPAPTNPNGQCCLLKTPSVCALNKLNHQVYNVFAVRHLNSFTN